MKPPYSLRIYGYDDDAESVGSSQRTAAERRFRKALDEALGDEHLVLPMHAAYQRLVSVYGEAPADNVLSDAEQLIFSQWQEAESAALTAALGPNRYLGDAVFEISPFID